MSVEIMLTLGDDQLEAIAVRVAEILAAKTSAPTTPVRAVTVAEAARRMGVSEKTIRRAIADGRLLVHRIGRSVRVDADALTALNKPRSHVLRPLGTSSPRQRKREFSALARERRVAP